jgi:hypothetical protein
VPTSVKVGERVTFLKVLTKVGGALQDTIAYHVGDDHVLIRETDILFVQDEPVRVSM